MKRAVALLVCIPALTFAQDGATVEGTVVNSVTHAPVAGVAVTLWTQQGVNYHVTTDESGVYRVNGVKPGQYDSRFEKTGFVEPPRPFPGKPYPVRVGAGGNPIQLDRELIPLAKLRGRVLDPDGNPAPDVEVGFNQFVTAKTDSDGQFVLSELHSGSYTLFAKAPPVKSEASKGERTEIVSTFYPSTTDRALATRIEVRGGDDLPGFEIRLQASPVYRVRGVVLDDSGKPLPKATVQLLSQTKEDGLTGVIAIFGQRYFLGAPSQEIEEASVESGRDGQFEFPSVRPGEWHLRADTEPKRDSQQNLTLVRSGDLHIVVSDQDLDGLELHFPEMFTLEATADWGDAPPEPNRRRNVTIFLVSMDDPRLGVPPFPTQSGSTLRFENFAAGRYRIIPMSGTVQGYYASAVLLGGQDVLGQPVDLSPTTPPLRIVYKPNAGAIRGTVEKGEGATVLLWPQTAAAEDPRRAIQAGAGGVFEINSLAPGDYYVVAVDRQNLTEAALRSLVSNATRASVDENGTATVALSLTHLPE